MRKYYKYILALAVLFSYSTSMADDEVFENSYTWKKLDNNMQQAYLDAKKNNAMQTKLECFVRLRTPVSQGDQDFLIGSGFVMRGTMTMGPNIPGHVTAEKLPRVAGQPFVQKIKLIVNK